MCNTTPTTAPGAAVPAEPPSCALLEHFPPGTHSTILREAVGLHTLSLQPSNVTVIMGELLFADRLINLAKVCIILCNGCGAGKLIRICRALSFANRCSETVVDRHRDATKRVGKWRHFISGTWSAVLTDRRIHTRRQTDRHVFIRGAAPHHCRANRSNKAGQTERKQPPPPHGPHGPHAPRPERARQTDTSNLDLA